MFMRGKRRSQFLRARFGNIQPVHEHCQFFWPIVILRPPAPPPPETALVQALRADHTRCVPHESLQAAPSAIREEEQMPLIDLRRTSRTNRQSVESLPHIYTLDGNVDLVVAPARTSRAFHDRIKRLIPPPRIAATLNAPPLRAPAQIRALLGSGRFHFNLINAPAHSTAPPQVTSQRAKNHSCLTQYSIW